MAQPEISESLPLVLQLSPGPSSRLRWAERLALKAAHPAGIVVDCKRVEFAEPMLALRLAAARAVQEAAGSYLRIVPPRMAVVRDYLAQVGLGEVMGVECAGGAGDVLLPITCIDSSAEVEPVAERLQAALGGDIPDVLSHAMMTGFSELCDNASTHGENDHGTFVLAQHRGVTELTLAVGDLGVGIPSHLSRGLDGAFDDADEGKLIEEALKPNVTGVAREIRGNGLPFIIEAMSDSGLSRAELRIWSGLGRANVRRLPQSSSKPLAALVGSYTRGTWAELVLGSCSRGGV